MGDGRAESFALHFTQAAIGSKLPQQRAVVVRNGSELTIFFQGVTESVHCALANRLGEERFRQLAAFSAEIATAIDPVLPWPLGARPNK